MKYLLIHLLGGLLAGMLLQGCHNDGDGSKHDSDDLTGDTESSSDGDTDEDTDGDTDGNTNLARNIAIKNIDIYQAVRIKLVENRAVVTGETVPFVEGRNAMMRIYVEPLPGFVQQNITAEIAITLDDNSIVKFKNSAFISDNSDVDTLDSTINIDIPGDSIESNFSYSVSLLQEGKNGNLSDARWPKTGVSHVTSKSTKGPLKIVIVPVRYNADGSGRLPDTGDEQIAAITSRFMELYPLKELLLSVRPDVFDWDKVVTAGGTGWDELLNAVTDLKDSDGVPGDVYYLALFKPAAVFIDDYDPVNSFCNEGCVMGLSWSSDSPEAIWSRTSSALGYSGTLHVDTILHEVGHAHGRMHAPAGEGVVNIDPGYPVADGHIDIQGYSPVNKTLMSTDKYYDLMGYEEILWISAYNYKLLFDRIVAVNTLFPANKSMMAHTVLFDKIKISPQNRASFGTPMEMVSSPGGQEITIDLYNYNDEFVSAVTGYFTPFSDLGGGVVWMYTDGISYASAYIQDFDLTVI